VQGTEGDTTRGLGKSEAEQGDGLPPGASHSVGGRPRPRFDRRGARDGEGGTGGGAEAAQPRRPGVALAAEATG
jgi:hypothetical protein